MTNFQPLYEPPNYIEVKNNFLKELRKSSRSQKSSISYIKNILPSAPLLTKGIVQAIVIGGTNFEFTTVKIGKNRKTILKRKKGILPQLKTSRALTKLFLDNYNPDVDAVGINFAFPLMPTLGEKRELDGILKGPTKEHLLLGLVGLEIGSYIRKNIYKKDIPITVANDTICLTLAGKQTEQVGLVLGTGLGISLKIEKNNKINIINLEPGDFNVFKKTATLSMIDSKSAHKGTYLFEKMVAGKYLVLYFNEKIKQLKLKIAPLKTSEGLSRLATGKNKIGSMLAITLLERSAFLTACALCAIYEFRKRPTQLEIITEGSLFWKGYKYKENVKKQLLALGVPKKSIKFKYVEDSSLRGAVGLLVN